MLDEIESKIYGRFKTLEESLEYQLTALNESVSIVKEIQYLLYLKDKIANKSDTQ